MNLAGTLRKLRYGANLLVRDEPEDTPLHHVNVDLNIGAGSVLQHLIANGGNTVPRLFRGAMLSSTELPAQYPFNHRIPEVRFSTTFLL